MRRAPALASAAAAVALLAAAAAPALAIGGRVEGTIVNGTTGGEGRADVVRLIRLQEGMTPLAALENVGSAFRFPDVEGQPGDRFLLQAQWGGVNYNKAFGFAENGVNVIEVTVYDTTSAWDGVRIMRYQVGLAAETELLRVFKIIEVAVSGSPPRAVAGEAGRFRFYAQPGHLHMRSVSAKFGTMPVNQEPIPLEGGTEFAIDFPLRPGHTEIQLSYDLPYKSTSTVFSEALLYPVEEMNVLIVPSNLEVTSEILSDRGVDEQNGLRFFTARDLPEAAPVVFRLSGEGLPPGEGHGGEGGEGGEGGGETKVVRVPDRTASLLAPALAGVLAPLVAGVVYALSRRPRAARRDGRRAADPALLAKREAILERIVALDGKNRAGEISEYAYWQKREALKGELVALLEEMGQDRGADA
jgi:hypothetical protein